MASSRHRFGIQRPGRELCLDSPWSVSEYLSASPSLPPSRKGGGDRSIQLAEPWSSEGYYYDEYGDAGYPRSWSTLALILSGLLGILVGFACAICVGGVGLAILLLQPEEDGTTAANLAPAPAAAPAPVPAAPAGVPTLEYLPPPAPVAEPFYSGGLGLTQEEWEQLHGLGSADPSGFISYENGTYLVGFQEGKVWHIERPWGPETPLTVEDARAESQNLIPADRQYLQAYSPEGRPDLVVDLYLSPSLASRFSGDWWTGGEPGNFTVTYSVSGYSVSRMVIALGNTP